MCASLIGLASLVAVHAQGANAAFDVASVKSHPDAGGSATMMRETPGTITYRRVSLLSIIRRAYNVEAVQVSGPAWLSSEMYDVDAKLPPDTPPAQMELMFQGLLAERFRLAVHRDKKELANYRLVVTKSGAKMHRSETGVLSYRPYKDRSANHLRGKITMPLLADYLAEVVGRPVSDQTGLEGLYDIEFEYGSDSDTATAPAVFTAIQEQLGLKLESGNALFDVIVVDYAEKVPVGN